VPAEKYRLTFAASVSKDLRAIPPKEVARILARVERIATDPRAPGCEKLAGQERYRARQGDFRILYEIDDVRRVVDVVKVAHRREVYRR